jgi:hypothetical protein
MLLQERDPITFWKGYLKTEARDLALMSITLFGIIINQAAVERVFSFVKETAKDRRNRLGLAKSEKILKVSGQLYSNYKFNLQI